MNAFSTEASKELSSMQALAGKYLTFRLGNESYGIAVLKVREIIQRLKNEGRTVFFSSHELGEVETVCDRVAIINQGELKAAGRVSDLVAQHQANLEKAFLDIIGYQTQSAS